MTSHTPPVANVVIKARHSPPPFTEAFLRQWLVDCWEDWMHELDRVLDDEAWVALVYEALFQRQPRSRTRGRPDWRSNISLIGALTMWSGR